MSLGKFCTAQPDCPLPPMARDNDGVCYCREHLTLKQMREAADLEWESPTINRLADLYEAEPELERKSA